MRWLLLLASIASTLLTLGAGNHWK